MDNMKSEPIAIIGMSCRFPGDADTPQGFWDLLSRGESAWGKVPKDRFNVDNYYHPSPERAGAITATSGFFVKEDVSKYDASFFSMTSAEAAGTDPQQRILLEVTYEAFENAGISLKAIAGTASSCDLRGPSMTIDTACSSSLVALHLAVQSLRSRESKVAVVGGANLIIQPELSRGLTALHFVSPDGKCHTFDERANGYGRGEGTGVLILKPLSDALRDNDTIRAIIRGSGLNQDGHTPGITMPSRDAQSELIRSTYAAAGLDFDQTAYFEAHGTGTSIGDPIELAAISSSLTENRDPANPLHVGSVKTNLGHLEPSAGVAGIIKTVLALENGKIPKVVGLEKLNPNLDLDNWHLKLNTELVDWPVAGIRRASVNSFGYGGANAHVILDDALHFLEQYKLGGNHTTFPDGVSENDSSDSGISVGNPASGTGTSELQSLPSTPKLFVLSSPEQSGVDRLLEVYSNHIGRWNSCQADREDETERAAQETDYMANFAYTLAERRSVFDWRRFAIASSMSELSEKIKKGLPKLRRAARAPACAYVFTGQGSQYFNMGRELQNHAVFRESVNAADEYVKSLGAKISQPLCTVLQIGIVDLLSHWGITPKAVVGHSSGEIAAAYASGALSKKDAWRVAYFRGVFSGRLPTTHPELQGTMMAVSLSESTAQRYVEKLKTGKAVVACINSPTSVTISGDATAIDEIEEIFKQNDVWCRKLKIKTAYHSHHMDSIADEYLDSIKDIAPQSIEGNSVTMFSSVTTNAIISADLGAAYWVQNMLQPVQFSGAVSALLTPTDARSKRQKKPNVQALVEIGPHSVLKGPLSQIFTNVRDDYKMAVKYISVLHRGNDAYQTALESIGQLWAEGHEVNLALVNTIEETANQDKVLTDLPAYPWNHERSHWHESRQNLYRRFPPGPRTDMLGYPMDGFHPMGSEPRWSNILKPTEVPWVLDHVIGGQIILPAAAMLSMVIEGCQKVLDPTKTVEGFDFRDVNFTRALLFQTPDEAIETALQFRPFYHGTKTGTYVWTRFSLMSVARDNSMVEHSNGLVRVRYVVKSGEVEKGLELAKSLQKYKEKYAEVLEQAVHVVDTTVLYSDINDAGMQFGPLFRLLSDMRGGQDVGCATLTIPDTAAVMPENFEYPLLVHPTVMDGVFQIMFSRSSCSDAKVGMSVIASIGSLYVSAALPNAPGTALRGYQTSRQVNARQVIGDLVISDSEFSQPFIIAEDVVNASVNSDDSKAGQTGTMLCTHMEWKEDMALLNQQGFENVLPANVLDNEESQKDYEVLDQAATIYIKRAIDSLASATTLDESSLLRKEWLFSLLTPDCSNTASSTEMDDKILIASSDLPQIGAALEALGSRLPGILDGSIDAAQTIREISEMEPLLIAEELLPMDRFNAIASAWFDLAGFKNADLRIFEFPSRSSSTAVSVLQQLSGQHGAGSRYGKYTLAQSDPSSTDTTKALVKKFPNLEVSTLDFQQESTESPVNTGKYDVVLVPDILFPALDIGLVLQHAKKILNPGGKLIIGIIPRSTLTADLILGLADAKEWWQVKSEFAIKQKQLQNENLSRILFENGFSLPELFWEELSTRPSSKISLLVSTLGKPLVSSAKEVVIIMPEGGTQLVNALASNVEKSLISNGFKVERAFLASNIDPSEKIFLSLMEVEDAVLQAPSEDSYDGIKTILLNSAGVLWVTRGGFLAGTPNPEQSAAIGLFRTLRSELPHLSLFNIDLSLELDITSEIACSLLCSVFKVSMNSDSDKEAVDHEYAESNGTLYIPRLVQDREMNTSLDNRDKAPSPVMDKLFQPQRPMKMQLGEVGLLDTFRFVDRLEYEQPLLPDRVDIEILATGLNFVDVMIALGYVPSSALGAEFSGRITAIGSEVPVDRFHVGQVVVGSTEDCFATHVRVQWKTIQPVPAGMSPEAAASCVIAYTTAYFALYDNGRLKKGDTILIHSAAGGLGQAAVQLAIHVGATVYATVGSTYKKELLMERYGIPENHIFTSRDTTFAKGVMRETKGRGVDVVLNSTYGEMLRQSWLCVADFGIFVEVGKRDILSNNMLEMSPFIRGCTFSAFNLAQYTEESEPHRQDACAAVVRKVFALLGNGDVKPPYPLTVMKITQAEEAFRGLQSGKFAGKIVITYDKDSVVPVMPKKRVALQVSSEGTYLLAGGLGGIGKTLAELLVEHGAKNIAFISRSGDSSDASKEYLEKLRGKNVQAKAYACDITKREDLDITLRELSAEMPEVKGFVHCAMHLKDSVFESMTHENWISASAPKIQGSWNMHELLPESMDFFVMLSSTSGIIGNPGQANYAAGNTFQNALAHHRRNKGMNATSIDLSAVTGIGYLAENAENYDQRNPIMKMQINEKEIHHIFLAAIAGEANESPVPPQLTTGIIGGEVLRSIMESAAWARDSKFMLLRKADGHSAGSGGSEDPTREAFIEAQSLAEASGVVETALVARLAKVLFVSPEDINIEQPLYAYGVDSLIAVEIRNWILKELKSEISIFDILSPMPIHILSTKISEGSKFLAAHLRLQIVEKKPDEEIMANDEEEKVALVDDIVASNEAVKIQGVLSKTEIDVLPMTSVERDLDTPSTGLVIKSPVDRLESIVSIREII
ncbi:putative Lovastatin nonaketide synthase [Glarea lozoyensis 74030]|uniref:Putative Lovastatin nonaketide synthase n=1 Tax=Glarea lozoyensis (strain ATCC 74030 / MF5533) TaxID=1104152 RepID=H0EWQ3_GLAL7|nr:putative Lovastatin nonaketide synthase [Glarea lozoyensis 74030]